LQVVVDLTTLLGLSENPGLAAGYPVPAQIARELASECGAMRRIVTDPVTGHLLDYGNRTYLPAPLKNFIAARDGTCRSPGCGQPAARSQLDHIEPYPTGPSNTHNTHSLCKRDHDSKTAGDFRVIEHDSSGRMSWRTRDGQQGVLGPRPYLGDPVDQSSPGAPSEPYPF
jgi:Tfp pilus assembly protein FimT